MCRFSFDRLAGTAPANAGVLARSKTPLLIGIVAPVATTVRSGNAVTARRYAGFFRCGGHRDRVVETWRNEPFDVLVALHARKSARSVLAFARTYPDRPVIVVLTGTDVYRDLARSRLAQRSIEAATAIVTLQEDAIAKLPRSTRHKAIAIVQSAVIPKTPHRTHRAGRLRICVLGHMRHVKDPLRAGFALRTIPKDEEIHVVQAGAALEERYARAARTLEAKEPRYRWLGDISHARAMRLLEASDVLALASRMEGGANAISEAIAAGTPVIASKISGNVGLLGRGYPAYFPVADTRACADLMKRCLHDPSFLKALRRRILALRPLVQPKRECRLWLRLIARYWPR
jgi:putative glycosyltransferase (TIGR04348 family)